MKNIYFCFWLSIIFFQLKSVKISVLGIGRLGLCTALSFERAGHDVLGVDVFSSYIDQINNKTFNSPEPSVNDYLSKSKNFKATLSLDEAIDFSDLLFIVVATPSTPYAEAYDHSILSKLLSDINKRKVKNKHIIICCTVFPGYINNVGRYLIRDCENVTLNYNPEFIAQGNIIYGYENPDIVLIGEQTKEIGDILEDLYKNMCKNNPKICRMSAESAEITKLSVNCFCTTKIAYANMIGDIADATPNANKDDILNAVGSDTRVGLKCLKAGYGFGGPCFPRDNRALGSYSRLLGIDPIIPSGTDESNKAHAFIMAEKMAHDADEFIFEDVNYKSNCNVIILEESQKLVVAAILAKKGKKVIIKDREAVINEVQQKFGNLFNYEIN